MLTGCEYLWVFEWQDLEFDCELKPVLIRRNKVYLLLIIDIMCSLMDFPYNTVSHNIIKPFTIEAVRFKIVFYLEIFRYFQYVGCQRSTL